MNVLVVSDNKPLVVFFKDQVIQQGLDEIASFEYAYSSTNSSPGDLIEMGMRGLNLKEVDVISSVVNGYAVVISLHCKQVFPKEIVEKCRCINFHPGLNPSNRGWYPQVFSIINKKPIGATVHVMDELVDHGGIIDQEEVVPTPDDTSFLLYNKVIEKEKLLIAKNIKKIIEGDYIVMPVGNAGNYNSIQDFKKLCALDLHHVGTLEEHIDLLRALTHGDFKNAQYTLEEKRFSISVSISDLTEKY